VSDNGPMNPAANLPIELDMDAIAAFCERNHIRKLSLFGSVLREDFGPDSDIDVLVEFEPGKTPGFAFFAMRDELVEMLGGRAVDLLTPGSFRPKNREALQAEAYPLYAAA
jgi:uncharacterized protein